MALLRILLQNSLVTKGCLPVKLSQCSDIFFRASLEETSFKLLTNLEIAIFGGYSIDLFIGQSINYLHDSSEILSVQTASNKEAAPSVASTTR